VIQNEVRTLVDGVDSTPALVLSATAEKGLYGEEASALPVILARAFVKNPTIVRPGADIDSPRRHRGGVCWYGNDHR
jgi:hypothetical protein